MRLLRKEHVYPHDWETVTSAWWTKYPNPAQPQVRACNTVAREINAEAQTFFVRRIFEINWGIPWVARKVLQKESVEGYAVEEIHCDYQAKKLTLHARNHSLSKYLGFEEECCYQQHPENPEWTVFTQNTTFRVTGFGDWLSSIIEKTQASSAGAGIGAMDRLIKRLEDTDWKAKAHLWDLELKSMLARSAAKLQERAVLCAEKGESAE
jgi:hypothetical protein